MSSCSTPLVGRGHPRPSPGIGAGGSRETKGARYPADPPRIEEIIAVMRTAGESVHGAAGPRAYRDPVASGPADQRSADAGRDRSRACRGSILVRHGKGGKRRRSGWTNGDGNRPSRGAGTAATLPVGPFLCVWTARRAAEPGHRPALAPSCDVSPRAAGVRRRFAPHQLRHAHAVEMAREGVPLPVIQRQLGHAHLGVTSTYLQGIDTTEIINTIHARRAPMIPASAGLRL